MARRLTLDNEMSVEVTCIMYRWKYENKVETVFEETMAEHFLKLMKDTNPQIPEI